MAWFSTCWRRERWSFSAAPKDKRLWISFISHHAQSNILPPTFLLLHPITVLKAFLISPNDPREHNDRSLSLLIYISHHASLSENVCKFTLSLGDFCSYACIDFCQCTNACVLTVIEIQNKTLLWTVCVWWQVSSGHPESRNAQRKPKRKWNIARVALQKLYSHVRVFVYLCVLPGGRYWQWPDELTSTLVWKVASNLSSALLKNQNTVSQRSWIAQPCHFQLLVKNKTIKHAKVRLSSQSSKSQLFKTPQNCQRWQRYWCGYVRTGDKKKLQSLFLSLISTRSLSHSSQTNTDDKNVFERRLRSPRANTVCLRGMLGNGMRII